MELVPIFQYKPVPPITYWWIWMSLQEVNISIGTQIRSGSTMINIDWHVKIDAQQLFYFMILPVGRILIDLAVSIKGTLQRCPQNFYICQVRRMLSLEPWKYPSYRISYWLWYHSLLVGQRECISSEHFSEGFLSRTWAEYLVVLVQLMLIWWKLYTLLSVC